MDEMFDAEPFMFSEEEYPEVSPEYTEELLAEPEEAPPSASELLAELRDSMSHLQALMAAAEAGSDEDIPF